MPKESLRSASEHSDARLSRRPPRNPYVFLVGCPRSGTTLLRRLGDAHPELAVAPQQHWLPRCWKRRRGITPEGMVMGEHDKAAAGALLDELGDERVDGPPSGEELVRAEEVRR